VAVGTGHTCALDDTGDVRCWGWNRFGQLGDGTNDDVVTASDASVVFGSAVAVVAGDGHTCAVDSSGNASCWGANGRGQLGIGTTDDESAPTSVLTSGIMQIAAGSEHTCLLTGEQRVYCFGANESGQLGDASTEDRDSPTRVMFDGM